MIRTSLAGIVSLVFFMSWMSLASAEWFDGNVAKVDLETRELAVFEMDPILEVEEIAVVSIVPATTFSGVAGLKDLRIGDEASIEANYHETTDSWQAVSVEILEAES